MQSIYKNIFYIFLFFFCIQITAQESNFWILEINSFKKSKLSNTQQQILPKKYNIFNLNESSFQKALQVKKSNSPQKNIIYFPNYNGDLEPFIAKETPVMDKELQQKFSNLKSYTGYSTRNPRTKVYFSTSPYGINAILYYEGKPPFFIDPIKNKYIQYQAKNTKRLPFYCKVNNRHISDNLTNKRHRADNNNKLRSFRLAVMTTGEYSQFHLNLLGVDDSASKTTKKEAVLSAVQNAITRVNSIYERDLGVRLILVKNNTDILFLNPKTDGLSNNSASKLINESQTVIDSKIGFNNYDIGHTFSTGGGGLASLASVCTKYKAEGVTGTYNPTGDPYHIDYVCHEIGHQFGATHTFNGNAGSCTGNNRNNSTAIEPGSGSTIMAYAGICAPENVQKNSDSYFNYISIGQIVRQIQSLSCPTITDIGNSAPVVKAVPNYTLPILTPFVLNATALDVDNDLLTYTWEQLDTELVSIPLQSSNTGGPAFRSIMPSANSSRFFPNKATVNNNLLKNKWEVLPSVSRTMEFAVTVRDNHTGGGRTSSQKTTLTFDENAGPFAITSHSKNETLKGNSVQTIVWSVANTNKTPINCTSVNILFSEDGGNTYPHTVAKNVPNNGKATIFIPNVNTNKGRIKVESVGNVFYAINKGTLKIVKSDDIDIHFIVQTKNQTCPIQKDGEISIIAQKKNNFTTTIKGKTYNFSKNIVINNLEKGSYDFCISYSINRKKCFSKILGKGTELKVEYTSKYPKAHFKIKEGTPPFYVLVNDKKVLKTEGKVFDIDVLNGDIVKIKSNISCEGAYEQPILKFNKIRAFPNPSNGKFNISVPKTSLSKVKIRIFNTIGQLILQNNYPVLAKRIAVDIRHLPTNIYIVEVNTENKKSIKIIKQ